MIILKLKHSLDNIAFMEEYNVLITDIKNLLTANNINFPELLKLFSKG